MTKIMVREKTYKTGRTILAADINNLEDLLVTSFNTMGELATSGLGVSTPFAVGTATASYHAISQAALDAAVTGTSTQITVDADVTVPASLGTVIYMQSLTAGRTITLPQNPSDGQPVRVWDMSTAAATYNITLARNTRTIAGASEDLVINLNGAVITIVYDQTNTNWFVSALTNIVQQ